MKSVIKWLGIIAFVMAIGFLMAACDQGNNDDGDGNGDSEGNDGGGSTTIKPTITIKNTTGYSVDSVLIKPSTEPRTWGSDFQWPWTFADGDSKEYTLNQPLSVCNKYDIRLHGGRYDFIKYGVTISNKMTITFTTGDLNDMSSLPKITIQNRSGKPFDSVHIKTTFSTDWSESFGGLSNNNDHDYTILIPPTNFTVFDIETKSSNPTNTYTKTNVTISNGMAILFTPLDRANPTIEDPVIIIQNNTGYNVEIYMRQSGSTDWGNNLLGYSNLDAGKSRTFSVSPSLGNPIDIRLRHGSSYFVQTGVTVSDGLFLTFTTSDLQTSP